MKELSISRVINGKRYNSATATLIASDCYWDGNNFERSGTNTWLYKTKGGAFFTVYRTMWQGDRNSLDAVTRAEAIELYEGRLTEHAVEYEEAFDAIVEEASAGRPTYYGKPMRQTAIWLPDEMIDWLKAQGKPMGDTIREMIKQAM